MNILTKSPVGIGIGGKRITNYFLASKNPRKNYLLFFRIEILLHLGVPDNQILLHFSVLDSVLVSPTTKFYSLFVSQQLHDEYILLGL